MILEKSYTLLKDIRSFYFYCPMSKSTAIKTVGIIGVGFVGDALLQSFKRKTTLEVRPYDKFKNIGSFESTLQTEAIFLALPTLYKDELIGYDKSSLYEVCGRLVEARYQGLVVIKSTVEPGTTEMLATKYGLRFVHNPEFLTARTARQDFENQKHVVLGRCESLCVEDLEPLRVFYSTHYPLARISLVLSGESEAMKSMVNTFYAQKVQIFNEFYLYCKAMNIDYDRVRELMLYNGWINPMHTTVPGPDGKLSYGGACFPKDTSALLTDMKRLGTPHGVLEACKKERDTMRQD